MSQPITDIVILGSGMVGMALAYQLTERWPDLSITLIDKETEIGHTVLAATAGYCMLASTTHPALLRPKCVCRGPDVCGPGVKLKDCLCWPAAR